MKKVISLVLSIAMLLSITAGLDFSAYALESTGQCGENVSWSFDSLTGELTISGTGKMYDYYRYEGPFDQSSIKSVVIENGITSIGEYAFYECSSLTSVTIPNSVTSIGKFAFSDCTSLTSVTIPDSVTSIGNYAFSDCTSLTSITIPNSVTSIEYYAFSNCSSLTSVTIPNSVTNIGGGAFQYCRSLTSITIPNSVTSIGNEAFYDCTSLTSVTIPNSVTSIGNSAFYNCRSLTSVTIPNSVTSIGNSAFYNCRSLTSVTIPNSVTIIGEYAFFCVNNIVYNGTASGSPWGAKAVNGYVDGYLVYKDSTKKELLGCFTQATNVTIPNSVTSIGEYAFWYCTSLTSVTIGNSVTSIGYRAFAMCSSLTSVTIPNSVTSIGEYAFAGCSSLTSVTIGNSVTSIGNGAFEYCSSLTSVTIPNSVTSIGDWAFYECRRLMSVTIGNSVTSIGYYAFSWCSSLTSVTIGNSATSIGYRAFQYCTSLKNVFYSGSKSQWQSISIASGNSSLTSAKIHYNSTGDHTWDSGTVIKQPTCTANGLKTYTCTVCNETKDETINAHHTYSSTVTKQPTCGSTGVKTYSCINCTATKTETLDATGIHTYSSTVTKQPTCTENGVRTYTCSVCSDSYTETISALGHSFTNYVSDDNFTCTEDGTKTAKCDRCDVTDTVTDVGTANHRCVVISEKMATCIAPGLIIYQCSACNEMFNEIVDELGHSFTNYVSDDNYTCTEDGTKTAKCDRCDVTNTVTDVGSVLGHEYISVTTQPTHLVDGYITYTCSRCNDQYVETPDQEVLVNKTNFPYPESPHNYSDSKTYNYSFSYPNAKQLKITFSSSTKTENGYDYIYIYNKSGSQIGKYSGTTLAGKTITLTGDSFSIKLTSDSSNTYYGFSFSSIYAVVEINELKAEGHQPSQAVVENKIDETCTTDGYFDSVIYCSVCNEELSREEKTINKLGHSFTNYVSDDNYTCTEDGTKTAKCDRCDVTNTVTDVGSVLGHEYISVTTQPTHLVDGYITYTCSRCNDRYVETAAQEVLVNETDFPYPESPHNYSDSKTYDYSFSYPNAKQLIITFSSSTKTESDYDYIYIYDKSGSQIGKYSGTTLADKTITLTGDSFSIKLTTDGSNTDYGFSLSSIYATVEIPELKAEGHSFTNYVSDDNFTCTEDGTKTAKCDRCDATDTVTDVGSALGKTAPDDKHNYALYDSTVTCSDGGIDIYKCSDCDNFKYVNINAGHSFTNYISDNNATCIMDGTKTAKCDRCDETDTKTITNSALGHNYASVVTAPTCTEQGYTTYTCTRCNDSYIDNYVEALGHTEVIDEAVAPTCTTTGLTEGKHCSVCNEVLVAQQVVEALGHKEVVDEAVAPTCTETGLTEGKHCSVCNEILVAQQVLEALGHNYASVVTASTCTEQGYTTYTCKVCKYLYKGNYKNATGHKAVTDKAVAATCTKEGKTAGSHCSVCKAVIKKQSVVKAKGHSYDKGKVTTKPTDKKTGVLTYTCKTCKAKKTEKLAKLTNVSGVKVSGAKKALNVSWKKNTKMTGYEIQYSTDKNFKKAKTVKVTKNSTTKTTIKKLSSKKYYYVRVRTYKIINGTSCPASWSKTIKVKTK